MLCNELNLHDKLSAAFVVGHCPRKTAMASSGHEWMVPFRKLVNLMLNHLK